MRIESFNGFVRLSENSPYPFVSGAFTAEVKGHLHNERILDLVPVLSKVAQNLVYAGSAPVPVDSTQKYFYELIRGLVTTNTFFERGNRLGELNFNPILLNPAFQPSPQLGLEELKTGRVLLSYSQGKESTLLKHFLTNLGIEFDTAYIYDTIQHNTAPDDYQVKLGDIWQWNPATAPLMSMGVSTPIVVYQRLLMWAYADAHGYDYVIFGDEIDNQALYRVGGTVYPSTAFFQSQYFYNILNYLGLSGTQLVSGLMNYSQERIYEYVIKKKLVHFSCFCNNTGWCNNCSKCKTTAYFANKFGTDMYAPYGLDLNKGYDTSLEKGLVLDFAQAYNTSLSSRCEPVMDDGFSQYYDLCIDRGDDDNDSINPKVHWDFGKFNSFKQDVLEAFSAHWKALP